jgi:aminodeoxyfutalosine synthase
MVMGAFDAAVRAARLEDIRDKIGAGERLTPAEGVRLYRSGSLPAVGALANRVRERLHGKRAYFVRNMYLNPTNRCTANCSFCGFYRPYRSGEGYAMTLEECLGKVRESWESRRITEVHIVGGLNPDYPYEFHLDLFRGIKALDPSIHIKAYTMVEIDFFHRLYRKPIEEILADFKEAGVGSLPGGGAEVLVDRVKKEIYPIKLNKHGWLEIARTAHRMGIPSNATMLYGHVETHEERIEHMVKLRELQDETGGLQAFVPLAFHPENTALSHLPGPAGHDHLMTVAVSRLMLDNVPHIKAYWVMLTPRIAQVALDYGADDLSGTVVEEIIVHMAGARTPDELTVDELCRLIREAGRNPVEVDTLFRPLREYGSGASRPAQGATGPGSA